MDQESLEYNCKKCFYSEVNMANISWTWRIIILVTVGLMVLKGLSSDLKKEIRRDLKGNIESTD